ncbi:hypothetical protein RQN30_07965 [Arcanobacterium hippocoleae]
MSQTPKTARINAMNFIDWALSVAANHPELQDSIVTANDDWLDILLSDGRTFRFRPGALIKKIVQLNCAPSYCSV